jgi:hypothetical protein
MLEFVKIDNFYKFLQTTYYKPFITYYLPLTTYHLPLTTYHLLLTTYYLPLILVNYLRFNQQ